MSDVMQAVAKDDPRWVAWQKYIQTEQYANAKKWAAYEEHADGSLWATFIEGWRIAEHAAHAKLAQMAAILSSIHNRTPTLAFPTLGEQAALTEVLSNPDTARAGRLWAALMAEHEVILGHLKNVVVPTDLYEAVAAVEAEQKG